MTVESYPYTPGLRDKVAHRVANMVLRCATPRYREFVHGSIWYGLSSASRDLTEGRESPPPLAPLLPGARLTFEARKRMTEQIAGHLMDDKYGWNRPHAGILEEAHQQWGLSTAEAVVKIVEDYCDLGGAV